jgi:hypothetical protein
VFLVENGDCLTSPGGGTPLAPWPDGSPACEAGEAKPRTVASLDPRTEWRTPLYDALVALELVPIRAQLVGHGTYPIVTLAGWRGPLRPDAPTPDLRATARKLCAAAGGQPFALFGGLDRTRLLRVSCPDTVRWDKL